MSSLARKHPAVILIPSSHAPRSLGNSSLPSFSPAALPEITFSPTSDFTLDLFSSNSPALAPRSSGRPKRTVSFQSSSSESSSRQVSRDADSVSMARTASEGSFKPKLAAQGGSPALDAGLAGVGTQRDFQGVTRASGVGNSHPGLGFPSSNGRLLARDPKAQAFKEEEEEEGDSDASSEFSPKRTGNKRESLADLLNSEPPWKASESVAAKARPSPARQAGMVDTPPSPPASVSVLPDRLRSSSASGTSQGSDRSPSSSMRRRFDDNSSSSLSRVQSIVSPASVATSGLAPVARPMARSPKVDGGDEVTLDSDGDDGPHGTFKTRRKKPSPSAELISFFSDTAPAPRSSHPSTPPTPVRNQGSPSPYLRSSPSVHSKMSDQQPSSAASSVHTVNEKTEPKQPKKGLKGLFSKAMGAKTVGDDAPSASSGAFDRSKISSPSPAPEGTAELQRIQSTGLDQRAAFVALDQRTVDLQDHSAAVNFPVSSAPPPVFPKDSTKTVILPTRPKQQEQQDFVRPRTKSAMTRSESMQAPISPFVRITPAVRVDNGESYLPRDDPPPRPASIARSASGQDLSSSSPAPGVIPWLTTDLGALNRLKSPVRSMSISRKPVSPELRNAVDLPPVHAFETEETVVPASSPLTSPTSGAPPAPLASRLAEVVARVTSPPASQQPLPTIYSPPVGSVESPLMLESPPRDILRPGGPRPDVSPASTITKADIPTNFPVPPVAGSASPSRVQKSLASAVAYADSIPRSDLIPLRSLLANATTADECRLLVNSLLALWKVPLSPPPIPTPEADVTPTPATPVIIPPTPVNGSGDFSPSDYAGSVYSTVEEEDNDYEVRVVAGRAAISKALAHE